MLAILITTLLLASPSLATPTSSSVPTRPQQIQHSRPFTLHAHVISGTQPYDNFTLEPYHIAPAYNYAVLFSGEQQPTGIVGYLNGTRGEMRDEEANLIFPTRSTTSIPYGFVIHQVNSTYNPIEINAGNGGTKGIFIDQGVIKYHNPMSGGFYACNKTLLYGPAIQLFYKVKIYTTPVHCSDVELVVKYVD